MTTTKTRRPARRTPEERRAQAEALHEQLTAQVATLAESENWKAWLRFAGTVRRRSFSNQMLILPRAARTASATGSGRPWAVTS